MSSGSICADCGLRSLEPVNDIAQGLDPLETFHDLRRRGLVLGKKALEVLSQDLYALDGINAEFRLEVQIQVQHLSGIARSFAHDFQQPGDAGIPILRCVLTLRRTRLTRLRLSSVRGGCSGRFAGEGCSRGTWADSATACLSAPVPCKYCVIMRIWVSRKRCINR